MAKSKIITKSFSYLLPAVFFLSGCGKNETFYYPESDGSGRSIFSNTGNNIFSCNINGRLWRSVDRIQSSWGAINPEVMIRKLYPDSASAKVSITWTGYFPDSIRIIDTISVVLSVPKDYTLSDLATLQGQRLVLDGINKYVSASIRGQNFTGPGVIYFNRLQWGTSPAHVFEGRMSGLLEADFDTVKLESGRFDHNLEATQVEF